MKTSILSIILLLAIGFAKADDKAYFQAMERNISNMFKAETYEDLLSIAKNFEKISEDAPDQWLPYYYTSFCYISMVFHKADIENMDEVLDKAEGFLNNARELEPDNDEIEVLQGWLYQGRIMVDPMGRGMIYSQKADASFARAQELNPENPRIYFLTGMNLYHTPEMFGGGKAAACPYFIDAMEKYDTFEAESSIAPDWGKEDNKKMVKNCNF